MTLTNTGTGVTRVATTNDDGGYQFAALIPGIYSVKASAAGFDAAVRTNIEIDVQSRPAIDFTLKVGSIERNGGGLLRHARAADGIADMGGVVQTSRSMTCP